jgi:hypothetical protein
MRSITSARPGSPGSRSRPSGDLADDRLRVLRGRDAVRDQQLARRGEAAHLDRSIHRAEEQGCHHGDQAEQDEPAQ